MTDRLNDLIATIHAQAETEIPIEGAKAATMDAFKEGADIRALMRLHPDYSDFHGRIYPLYDEDEGVRTQVYDENEKALNEVIEDISYHWDNLVEATRLDSFANAYAALVNQIHTLSTWHPGYNYDHGTIDTGK